jgi:hypothetical protein
VQRQPDLLQVVVAFGPPGCFASRLYGGQQQSDQDSDDGNHYQQFDERETAGRP